MKKMKKMLAMMLAAALAAGSGSITYNVYASEELTDDLYEDGLPVTDEEGLTDDLCDEGSFEVTEGSVDDQALAEEIPYDTDKDGSQITIPEGVYQNTKISVAGSSTGTDVFTTGATELSDGGKLTAYKGGSAYDAVTFTYGPDLSVLNLKDYRAAQNAGVTVYSTHRDGIYYKGNLKIICEGKNEIFSALADQLNSGIYVEGNLIITNKDGSDASLDINMSNSASEQGYGIYCGGNLEIKNSGSGSITVTAAGSPISPLAGTNTKQSFGIKAEENIRIKDAKVTAAGGSGGKFSYGLQTSSGDITISGGKVFASGADVELISCGVQLDPDAVPSQEIHTLTVEDNGSLDASAKGDAIETSYMTVKSGTVNAASEGGLSGRSFIAGVLIYKDLTMQGGRITARGPDKNLSTCSSYGIYMAKAFISGGTIDAAGGNFSGVAPSYGIYMNDGCEGTYTEGMITCTGGVVTSGISLGLYVNNPSSSAVTTTKTLNIEGTILNAKGYSGSMDGYLGSVYIDAPYYQVSINYDGSKAITWTGGPRKLTEFSTWKYGIAAPGALHTVTFDLNGIQGTPPEPQVVAEGAKVLQPAAPTAKDLIFAGWFTDKECTEAFDFSKTVTKDTTLYAKWKKEDDPTDSHSTLDPVPVIEGASELWLVKGQKFTMESGWISSKKSVISITKKGAASVKREGEAEISKGDRVIKIHAYDPTVPKKLNLEAGNTEMLNISDYNAQKMTVLFYSAAPDIAAVDKTGKVTAYSKGSAKITAYINGVAKSCTVKVMETTPAKERTLHLNVNASKKINIKGLKNPQWTALTDGIVSIKTSKIKGLKPGKTVLTASVGDTTYKVNVIVEDITLSGEGITAGKRNKYTLDLKKSQTTDLKFASVEQAVIFKSSKPDIAFIDEKGHVEARSKGKAKFTTKINGKTVTVNVNVTE